MIADDEKMSVVMYGISIIIWKPRTSYQFYSTSVISSRVVAYVLLKESLSSSARWASVDMRHRSVNEFKNIYLFHLMNSVPWA